MYQDQISLADFVQQEAREKCFEIDVKAFKQFEKEKKAIVEKEKLNIQEETEIKMKKKYQQERIKHSAIVNKCRLEKMQARNKALMKVFSDVQYQVYRMIQQDKVFYKQLLKQLMVQGLIRLFEHKVKIRCLEKDINLVKECIGPAKKEFLEILKKELDIDFECEVKILNNIKQKIEVDENKSLVERELHDNSSLLVARYDENEGKSEVIHKTQDDKRCFGGILLTSVDGLIICKNTLDVRTDLCVQESLPDIRAALFPIAK